MSSQKILGQIKSIYICAAAGDPMLSVPKVRTQKDLGLEGDRYATKKGFWQNVSKPRECTRDVSIINAADIVNSGFSEAETRRNIVVEDRIDLLSLIGKRFFIGEVLFEGTEDCTPCKRPSELVGKPNFATVFKTTGGLRARVMTDGIIKIGDVIRQA